MEVSREQMKLRVDKAITLLSKHIDNLEKANLRQCYKDELIAINNSKVTKSMSEEGMTFYNDLYVKSRQDGHSIKKSQELANKFYTKDFSEIDLTGVLKSIDSIVVGIRDKIIEKSQK